MLDRRQEILKTLRATPVVLRALVADVDEARLRRRPSPGEWAIIEVVAHVADTEERALGRVRRYWPRRTGAGAVRPGGPGRAAPLPRPSLKAELARLERLRAEHLALLSRLDGLGWERTGRHGEHGDMSLELYETHVAAEEVDHLAQIARLL
jgi:hypothetical protein